MNLTIDEFFEYHRPKKITDVIVSSRTTNDGVIPSIIENMQNKRSFVVLSDRHGSGKHVLIDLVANSLNITLVRLHEDTNINDLVLRDNNMYDITSFVSSNSHSPYSRYFVVEQCAIRKTNVLNATFQTHLPCIYMYTTENYKNDQVLKRITKSRMKPCKNNTEPYVLRTMILHKVPISTMQSRIENIIALHSLRVTKQACALIAKRSYGNVRIMMTSLYQLIQTLKKPKDNTRKSKRTRTDTVRSMLQSNFIDSFDRFTDTRDRCKDKTFTFEDRVRMGVSHSYALFQYTYTSVIENCRDPWHKGRDLSIDGTCSWTELFSFTDSITRNEQDMVVSMFFLN